MAVRPLVAEKPADTPPRGGDRDRRPSPPPCDQDAVSDFSNSSASSSSSSAVQTGEQPERRHVDILAQVMSTRSEEYRLLFRLPHGEVLVQDFNCAIQENILLQGHMYLFIHHICFYSNIFGFETKRVISYYNVTCVRKAKTAAIFPTAIEIVTGDKKHFFGSFLSRDEAYNLIVEGWQHHSIDNRQNLDCQDSKSESNGPESAILERENDIPIQPDCTDFTGSSEIHENGDTNGCSSIEEGCLWQPEDADAPKVPDYFIMVAEEMFPVQVEDFFKLFFSDDATDFLEKFHKSCGDKDFQCGRWQRNAEFVHARDLSFQHPIKIYFGAKFGHCQTIQKFRVYRKSHLVIEASQQVSDVPYGDHFHVQVLWDVEKDLKGDNRCLFRVYINVAFSRKTMWKGKIEQSTIDECREVYRKWISNAHELLAERNLEESEGPYSTSTNINHGHETHDIELESSFALEHAANLFASIPDAAVSEVPKQQNSSDANIKHVHGVESGSPSGIQHHVNGIVAKPSRAISEMKQQQNFRAHAKNPNSVITDFFSGSLANLSAYARNQHFSSLSIVAFLVILLMQLCIIMLLTRVPEVRVVSQDYYMGGLTRDGSETVEWLEKRVYLLSKEMNMMELRLDRMRQDFSFLKGHLQDLQKSEHKR